MALRTVPAGDDRLLTALLNCEGRLNDWIQRSENNARLFASDPVAAMRAADLGMDQDVLDELQTITSAIARKLQWAAESDPVVAPA